MFGVERSLARDFAHEAPGAAPDGRRVDTPRRRLAYDFGLKPDEAPAARAAA